MPDTKQHATQNRPLTEDDMRAYLLRNPNIFQNYIVPQLFNPAPRPAPESYPGGMTNDAYMTRGSNEQSYGMQLGAENWLRRYLQGELDPRRRIQEGFLALPRIPY